MPPKVEKHFIRVPRGYRAAEAATFLAQFDDLSRRLWEDLADITPAELAWQPKPGMNTIGMLLAHNAIVEVFWIQRATSGFHPDAMRRVLGLGMDDDGMPLPPGGAPPRALKGWDLEDHRALGAKARAFAKRHARWFTAADLEREVRAATRDGRQRRFNVRWILYHLLEHFAGHYGQVLLLRHQYRDRNRKRR